MINLTSFPALSLQSNNDLCDQIVAFVCRCLSWMAQLDQEQTTLCLWYVNNLFFFIRGRVFICVILLLVAILQQSQFPRAHCWRWLRWIRKLDTSCWWSNKWIIWWISIWILSEMSLVHLYTKQSLGGGVLPCMGYVVMCCYEVYAFQAIAVITVAPTGKASFVYSYVQTRLQDQYNGKWPLASFMC